MKLPQLLAIADLRTRWEMSRQGVHQRMKQDPDFPVPVMRVANDRIALFLESEIVAYEIQKPWVANPSLRDNRRRFLFALQAEND
jgi:hypothetical protein